jgi:shikimate dehydrogenase
MTRLAVLGSPIAHSKSPQLHLAAYRVLGLDWAYERVEVDERSLPAFLDALGPEWRGFSATMPVKRAVRDAADEVDEVSRLTGGANTLLLTDGRRRAFNTDVAGIVRAFSAAGIASLDSALVLGAGATASSVLVAVARLGATNVVVAARTPERAQPLVALGDVLGVTVTVRPLGDRGHRDTAADAVISTLPGGVESGVPFTEGVRRESVLFDVAYDPWPSALAREWSAVHGRVIDGLEMLIEQALVQVGLFVTGEPDVELDGEDEVLAAMRAAVARVTL